MLSERFYKYTIVTQYIFGPKAIVNPEDFYKSQIFQDQTQNPTVRSKAKDFLLTTKERC